jgi:protocatechuate 3,4-dioxygenase beta subunit
MKRFGIPKWVGAGIVCAAIVLWVCARFRHPDAARPAKALANREEAAPAPSVDSVGPWSSIAGNVTDMDFRPISSAHVCAVPPGVAAGSTKAICVDADPRGYYVIPGLPSGRYLVTAAHAGFVTGAANEGRWIELLADTANTKVDIVLENGGAKVTGFVVDATGGPVPHATIRGERTVAPRVAVDAEADDLGRFTMWFPPGIMFLVAQAEGYAPARWSGPAPATSIRLVLTPGATVRGIVVSSTAGAPLPKIEVRAVPVRNAASLLFRSSTTLADGTFDVRGIEPGSYTLLATGDGWRGEYAQPIRFDLGGTVEHIRIEASRAATVEGRVALANAPGFCEQGMVGLSALDPNEAPPEQDELPPRIHSGPSFMANIGPSGVVHFPAVAPGHYLVHVDCFHNRLRDGPRTLDVGSTALTDLTWTVSPGLSLTVLAVDGRDRPMPGFVVYLHYPGGPARPGPTDEAGRYDFSGVLSPGNYEISAQPPFESARVRVELRDGDGPVTAKLKIKGAASIVTTVRERRGGPVDGLWVTAVAQSSSTSEAEVHPHVGPTGGTFMATALGEGRYRVEPLKPGRYEIRAADGTNATTHAAYEVSEGEALQTSMEIDRGGRIRGRVVDDDGSPVADAWVTAITADSDRRQLPPSVLEHAARALTDQEGRFVLDRLAGGDASYSVRVEQPSGGAAVKEGVRVDDADVVIALRAAGTLTGAVEGDCGGSATPVRLQAVSLTTGQRATQDLAPGQPFRVNLAPGAARLLAFCQDGHGMAQLTTEVMPKQETSSLRLVLQATSANLQGPP